MLNALCCVSGHLRADGGDLQHRAVGGGRGGRGGGRGRRALRARPSPAAASRDPAAAGHARLGAARLQDAPGPGRRGTGTRLSFFNYILFELPKRLYSGMESMSGIRLDFFCN